MEMLALHQPPPRRDPRTADTNEVHRTHPV
jgi:hypothetical protein